MDIQRAILGCNKALEIPFKAISENNSRTFLQVTLFEAASMKLLDACVEPLMQLQIFHQLAQKNFFIVGQIAMK